MGGMGGGMGGGMSGSFSGSCGSSFAGGCVDGGFRGGMALGPVPGLMSGSAAGSIGGGYGLSPGFGIGTGCFGFGLGFDPSPGSGGDKDNAIGDVGPATAGGLLLPDGVPPPPTGQGKLQNFNGDAAFSDFMTAFRSEMRLARDQGERQQKYVPSSKIQLEQQAAIERRANEIFGIGADSDPAYREEVLLTGDDYDEWPDEFLLLGVAEQEPAGGSTTPSPESETSTTSETASTEETEDEEDFDDDAWPMEMLIG